MNKMQYRGYTARIEFDEDDRIFVGHLAGIKDIVGFHGTTVDELESAFHESVDAYIAISEEQGRRPQKPYSGRLCCASHPRSIPQSPRPLAYREKASTSGHLKCWVKRLCRVKVFSGLIHQYGVMLMIR